MFSNKNGEGEEAGVVRVFTSAPKEKFVGKWESGRLYPLYNVVENNGSKFMSLTGKIKEEPYVIYDKVANTFYANDGWVLKEMSADSRISAFGGSGSGVSPEEMQAALAGKQDVITDLSTIRSNASSGASAYHKPTGGIPKTDLASAVRSSLDKADSALQSQEQSDWNESDSGDPAYIKNKPSIPTVPTISTDISTDADSDTKTASPKAVKTSVDNNSSPDAVKYVSQSLTTEQKTQARTNIGAASSSDLSAKQDALVSGTNIKTINQTSLLGSGDITIENGQDGEDGQDGADGVGFESISTPSTADGTFTITLSNGDTIVVDMNHDHTAYPKYVLCADEAAYAAITTKDSATLYLIPEV